MTLPVADLRSIHQAVNASDIGNVTPLQAHQPTLGKLRDLPSYSSDGKQASLTVWSVATSGRQPRAPWLCSFGAVLLPASG